MSLERKEYLLETNEYKVKNPTQLEYEEVAQKINEIATKSKKQKNLEEVFETPKFLKYMFEKFVISDNIDYQFEKYSLSKFTTLFDDYIEDIQEIELELILAVTRYMHITLKKTLADVEQSINNLTQAEILEKTVKLGEELQRVTKEKNERIENNKRKETLKTNKNPQLPKVTPMMKLKAKLGMYDKL